ncbi:NAD(P)H-dependent flavin oxidoreductase [Paraburkholderia youngii]|uniref:NAD(P)H-dependent flavin oxidoreductase n=1 Tax=Paraburkholderia youngii TaxID=2782701 RepID=UPI003D241ACF
MNTPTISPRECPLYSERRRAGRNWAMATATKLDEAGQIAAARIDAIVAQGIEAGGHRGMLDPAFADERLGTMALVRLLLRESSLRVVAAGAIMDGAGIAAVLALGAQAAQLGTAFLSTVTLLRTRPTALRFLTREGGLQRLGQSLAGPLAASKIISLISGKIPTARGYPIFRSHSLRPKR